jgi:RecA/RadA recombinase
MNTETTPAEPAIPHEDLQPVASSFIQHDKQLETDLQSPDKAFENSSEPPPPPPPPPVRQRQVIAAPNILDANNELSKIAGEIMKQNGAGSICTGDKLPGFNQIPTGVFVLDYSLLGGVHMGLASQFYGWENVGKTSMILRVMRNFQMRYPDRVVVFAPLEGTFDPEHAKAFGVDLSRVLIVKAASTEEMIDNLTALYHAEQVSAMFLDSIPAMVPKAIIEKSAEDKTMAEAARLLTILLQKLNAAQWVESRRGHLVSFFATNQWRLNPGKMFGDPRYLPGGNHQKFYFTNFIEIKSKEAKGDDQTGNQVLAQLDQSYHIDKAKVGAVILDGDFKTVVSPNHPSGLQAGAIDDAGQVATIAKKHGMILGGGGTWKITTASKAEHRCKNLEEITAFFYGNPDEYIALKQRIIADLRGSRGRPPFPPDGYLLNRTKLFVD